LAMERVSDTSFLGWCSLTRWNPDHRSASLGYCLDQVAWGHGYATEAARSLLQWAFDTLDLNRVQAETDTRNAASARVLEKLGFVREGTLREDCIVDSEVSDSWVYGLLRRQWSCRPGRPQAAERSCRLVSSSDSRVPRLRGPLGMSTLRARSSWIRRSWSSRCAEPVSQPPSD